MNEEMPITFPFSPLAARITELNSVFIYKNLACVYFF